MGWVYEANHTKKRTAQRDLDDFLLSQRQDDINNTKQAELDALDELDDGLSKYIESLKYKHEEWNRLEEERLIKQLLNASNMEEVNNKILDDFNHFVNELNGDYKNYDGIFTNFLDDYRDNNIELQKLQQERLELLNPDNYLHQNDYQEEPDTNFDVTDINQAVEDAETKQHDMDLIKLAGKGYAQAAEQGNYDLAALWHDFAEDIRAKYGYSGGEDGSKKILLSDAQIKDLEQMVTYEGKTMTKREANLRKHGNLIGNYFSQQDTQAKDYYAKEMSNVLMHESNTIKEAGLNEDLVANWISYNRNTQAQYDLQNMNFSDFIDKYADELVRYKKLVDEMMATGDYANSFDAAEDLGNVSSGIVNGNKETLVLSRDGTYMTKADADRLEYLGKNWQNYSGSYSSAHAEADEIRRKYGYTTDAEGNKNSITQVDKDKWNATQNYKNTSYTSNKNIGSSSSNNKNSSTVDYTKDIYNYTGLNPNYNNSSSNGTSIRVSGNKPDMSRNSNYAGKTITQTTSGGVNYSVTYDKNGYATSAKKSYANGLEGGPVTYTGLAMLHGTYDKPEYVINNDQAYNMLYNLSRNRIPEHSSNLSNLSQGTVYTLNGDIIIDGATDPKKFWSEVTKNMNIRSNVTKNK